MISLSSSSQHGDTKARDQVHPRQPEIRLSVALVASRFHSEVFQIPETQSLFIHDDDHTANSHDNSIDICQDACPKEVWYCQQGAGCKDDVRSPLEELIEVLGSGLVVRPLAGAPSHRKSASE